MTPTKTQHSTPLCELKREVPHLQLMRRLQQLCGFKVRGLRVWCCVWLWLWLWL